MAEEHGFQSPESHRLCANNCGFFGSSATKNMCSKCYGDICLKDSGDRPLLSKPATAAVTSSSSTSAAAQPIVEAVSSPESAAVAKCPASNRCSACRKKVGLTGFPCKCGTTFCGTHRYPEKHDCTFDYKAAGREAIAKANPLVKGDKIQRI